MAKNLQYAFIKIDDINLLLPQHEISVISEIDSIKLQSKINPTHALGHYNNSAGCWPVFSFSENFQLRSQLTTTDRYFVCLHHAQTGQFGIVCTQVSAFNADKNKLIQSRLQNIMMLSTNPIIQLVYYQELLFLESNVNKLHEFLTQ